MKIIAKARAWCFMRLWADQSPEPTSFPWTCTDISARGKPTASQCTTEPESSQTSEAGVSGQHLKVGETQLLASLWITLWKEVRNLNFQDSSRSFPCTTEFSHYSSLSGFAKGYIYGDSIECTEILKLPFKVIFMPSIFKFNFQMFKMSIIY